MARPALEKTFFKDRNYVRLNGHSTSVFDRQTQYKHAADLIDEAKHRLIVVERSPTVLEMEISETKTKFSHSVERAIARVRPGGFSFHYLFDAETSRKELIPVDGKSRNFAVLQIYKLKKKQVESNNSFRFDPIENASVPLVISDDTLAYFNVANSSTIIETIVRDKKIVEEFASLFSVSNITSAEVLASALELQYDDRQKVLIVDSNDLVLGLVPRITAHEKGLFHRGTHLTIRCGANLLICKRAAHKAIEPNKWDFSVSGHCDPQDLKRTDTNGDPYLPSILREAQEELNLDLEADSLVRKGKFQVNCECGEKVLVSLYECHIDKRKSTNLLFNKEEVEELRWVHPRRLRIMAKNGELAEWYAKIVSKDVTRINSR